MPRPKSSYTIRSGDVLQIEVLEDASLNRSALVLPDGTISFPFVGSLRVSGRTVDQARSALASGIASNFAAPPTVTVSVGTLGQTTASTPAAPVVMSAFAMGEVNKPGQATIEDDTTLLQFLASVGGFTKFAATKRVELHRVDPKTGTEKVYRYDYQNHRGISGATQIQAGDVVVVPERRLFE